MALEEAMERRDRHRQPGSRKLGSHPVKAAPTAVSRLLA
jgi:hypothetical protein